MKTRKKKFERFVKREACKSRFRVFIFDGICRTLQGLSKITLVNIVTFVVLKILYNAIFVKTCLFTNNCCHKQNLKNVQRIITFIFTILSETINGFL